MIELGQENQNLQVVQTKRSNRKWEKDSEIIQCNGCAKKFSVSIRKVKAQTMYFCLTKVSNITHTTLPGVTSGMCYAGTTRNAKACLIKDSMPIL